jgi:hypothetical protein
MGPPNLLDTLLALGEYTTIVDVIYNHYDRFGNLVGKLIENKMAVHRGPPSLSFSSWTSCCTEVPPGALGFQAYQNSSTTGLHLDSSTVLIDLLGKMQKFELRTLVIEALISMDAENLLTELGLMAGAARIPCTRIAASPPCRGWQPRWRA